MAALKIVVLSCVPLCLFAKPSWINMITQYAISYPYSQFYGASESLSDPALSHIVMSQKLIQRLGNVSGDYCCFVRSCAGMCQLD